MSARADRLRFGAYVKCSSDKLLKTVVSAARLAVACSPSQRRFVEGLLDWLFKEALSSDRDALDAWNSEARSIRGDVDCAAIVSIAFSTIAQSYAADVGHSDEVTAFLTSRSEALVACILHGDASSDRKRAVADLASCDSSVSELLSSMESHDIVTCEHSRAVGQWSQRLAKNLGLNSDDQRLALVAGTLHDIGKVHTPRDILRKTGPLDAQEWIVMREHATAGAEMLERIPELRHVAPFVAAHHERLDGKGYPRGLAGSDIAVITRIVSVADSFHAMIGRRPYRPSLSVPAAFGELQRGRGSQFDSDVVEVGVTLLKPIHATELRRFVNHSNSV